MLEVGGMRCMGFLFQFLKKLFEIILLIKAGMTLKRNIELLIRKKILNDNKINDNKMNIIYMVQLC